MDGITPVKNGASKSSSNESASYIVEAGDTLSSIAIVHKTTVKELLALNPSIKDPDKIFAGQKITIPSVKEERDVAKVPDPKERPVEEIKYYTSKVTVQGKEEEVKVRLVKVAVGTGDSLSKIANKHKTGIDAVISANPGLTRSSVLKIGQTLWVPDGELTETAKKYIGKTFKVETSGYNSEAGQTDSTPTVTANQKTVSDGTVACNFLPFGAQIKIEGYGDKVFTVRDRMNARYTNNMDIWFSEKKDAVNYGRKTGVKIDVVGVSQDDVYAN